MTSKDMGLRHNVTDIRTDFYHTAITIQDMVNNIRTYFDHVATKSPNMGHNIRTDFDTSEHSSQR